MVRTNLCPNPSFAYGTRGWANYIPSTIRAGTDQGAWGDHTRQSPGYLAIDIPNRLQGQVATPGIVEVEGGQALAVSALLRTSPGIAVTVEPEWTINGKTSVGTVPSLLASSAEGTRPTWAFTAPAGATACRIRFGVRTVSDAEAGSLPGWVHLDDVMITTAPTVAEAITAASEFFDGDTPQRRIGYSRRALTHEWVGARGVSASREVETDLDMTAGPVAIVDGGMAPRVQVVIPARLSPVGAVCHVVGVAENGFTWTPRGGAWTGGGVQRVIGDPLAPINVSIRYRLTTSAGVSVESDPVRRSWGGLSLMTDTAGGKPVNLLWQGADQHELRLRVTEHEVPGRATPLVVYAPKAGAGTVSLTARTNMSDTSALKELLRYPTPVALFHNPARCMQCMLGTCDVDLVTVMAVTSASMERAPRLDVAERTWALKGTIVSLPQPNTPLALSTWADFDARSFAWNGLDSRRWSWEAFDRTLWQEES